MLQFDSKVKCAHCDESIPLYLAEDTSYGWMCSECAEMYFSLKGEPLQDDA